MTRGILALGALIVAGSVLALWLVLKKDDPAAAKPAATEPSGAHGETRTPPPSDPGVTVTTTPKLPEAPQGGSSETVSEYSVGGVAVRDHRSGDHRPRDVPQNIHPPGSRKIDSQLTYDISQKVRAVTKECAGMIPRDARGSQPKVEGQIIISIKDKQLTVTGATMQVRDVTSAADTVRQCIEQKSVGLATSSGDELDVQDYSITLSLDLP